MADDGLAPKPRVTEDQRTETKEGSARAATCRDCHQGLRYLACGLPDSTTRQPQSLMRDATASSQPSYYDILRLPRSAGGIDLIALKSAYRKLLLKHHPDKSPATSEVGKSSSKEPQADFSIDLIMQAYQTLSNDERKKAYDKLLESEIYTLEKGSSGRQSAGFGTYELEELDFDGISTWSCSCRCGLEKGYILTEEDLQKESSQGEVYVGCHGCTLSIKVLFGTVDIEDAVEELASGNKAIPNASSH